MGGGDGDSGGVDESSVSGEGFEKKKKLDSLNRKALPNMLAKYSDLLATK